MTFCATTPAPFFTMAALRIGGRVMAVVALALVSGCANPNKAPDRLPATLVDKLMASSSDRLSRSWELMARTEAAAASLQAPLPVAIDLDTVPEALRKPISWSQTLPIDQALKGLADRLNFQFKADGERLAVLPTVTIHADDTPAVLVLQDIGLQLGARGAVQADPNTDTIYLHLIATMRGAS